MKTDGVNLEAHEIITMKTFSRFSLPVTCTDILDYHVHPKVFNYTHLHSRISRYIESITIDLKLKIC